MDLTKTIWKVQNNFGPIEGQGIRAEFFNFFRSYFGQCDDFIFHSEIS